jgi:DNA-binding beta-propeller fold protein YncE
MATRQTIFTAITHVGNTDKEGENAQLRCPQGIAIGAEEVFVANEGKKCVNVYKMDGTYTRTIGDNNEALEQPCALAIAGVFLYVLDVGSTVRVRVLNKNTGQWVRDIGNVKRSHNLHSAHNNDEAERRLEWSCPRGVAVFGDRLYVTDSGNNRVCVYEAEAGNWVCCFSAGGLMWCPVAIAVTEEHVIVTDNRSRVLILNKNYGLQTQLRVTGNNRDPNGQYGADLSAIAVVGCAIYLADAESGNIAAFSTILSENNSGILEGEYILPNIGGQRGRAKSLDVSLFCGLAVQDGRFYLTDSNNHVLYICGQT